MIIDSNIPLIILKMGVSLIKFLDQNNVEYIVLHRDVDTLNKRVSKFLTHEYFEKYLSHSNFLKVYDSLLMIILTIIQILGIIIHRIKKI